MGEPYHDKATLERLYHGEGLTQEEMASRFGVTQTTISTWMVRLGVTKQSDRPYHDEEILRKLYHDEGLSQEEIAEQFDVAPNTISEWMGRLGITTRPFEDAPYKQEKVLRYLHHDEGLTWEEMADRFGVGKSTIQYWLQRHGIEGRSPNRERYDIPEDDLREMYAREGRSARECAEHFGCTPPVILTRLRKYDIPVRDNAGAQRSLAGETVPLMRKSSGYHVWQDRISGESVAVHQLTAIDSGADPQKAFSDGSHHVHHKNTYRIDDRPSNLELITKSQHMATHRRNEWTETNGFPELVTVGPGEME